MQTAVHLLHRDFGNIAFRHEIPGNLFFRVDFFPFSVRLVERVSLDSRNCCANCTASRVSGRDRVHKGRLHVASFPRGSFQSLGDTSH